MPAKIPVLSLLGALASAPVFSQASYREERNISDWQNAAPSEGPGAARFNPAALADVHLVSAWGAYGAPVTGKGGRIAFQAAAGIPPELAVLPFRAAGGLGWFSRGTELDGSNAVYQEAELVPALALGYPAANGSAWRIAAGLASPILWYNAFNVVQYRTRGMDAGLQGSYAFPGFGRAGLGFAYHYLGRPRIKLPNGGDDYYAIPGWMEYGLDWTSSGGMIHARADLYLNDSRDPSEGPANGDRFGMNGWEIEVRPWHWLGIKVERPRIGRHSTLGAVFRPSLPLEPARGYMAFDFGHDAYDPGALPFSFPFRDFILGESDPEEGRGFRFNLALGAEI